MAARLGLDPTIVEAAASGSRPSACGSRSSDAAAESERRAATARRRCRAAAGATRLAAEGAARRAIELQDEIERVRAVGAERRASARSPRPSASSLTSAASSRQLRAEIRAARAAERARRPSPWPAAGDRAERERDRRLGAASERVRARALRARRRSRTVRRTAPLAVGDPVISPSLGVRGVIVEISGDEAEVHAGALRVRVPLARLAPDPQGRAQRRRRDPTCRCARARRTDVADELDVRGGRADEAREAARAYVDAAHLAGRAEVRIIHGREPAQGGARRLRAPAGRRGDLRQRRRRDRREDRRTPELVK